MSASVIRRPFSESSPNVSRQSIFNGSPKKLPAGKKLKQGTSGTSSPRKKAKKMSSQHLVIPMKQKQKKQKNKSSLSQKGKDKAIPAVESGAVSKDPRAKKVPRASSRGGSVITKAAIRRIAAKHDIAQISSETVRLLSDFLTQEANECLLKARSSALHVSRRKTVGLQDLACAAKSCRFGDLVCA